MIVQIQPRGREADECSNRERKNHVSATAEDGKQMVLLFLQFQKEGLSL